LRLRSRDLPALQFFKDTLEDRIGVQDDKGVLAFSIIKHTLLLLLGLCFMAVRFDNTSAPWQSFFEAALFAWLTMLLSTYVVAQMLYRKTSGHWLSPLAPLLRLCALSVRPLTAILGFFQSLVELSEPGTANQEADAGGQIEALISAGEEEGLIEKDDRRLIESVVAFGDKTVREVMTPRPKIVAIEADRSLEELRELAIRQQYSRIPVYEQSIDHIIGFAHMRDMFELDEADREGRLVRELVRPIRFVPETKPVDDLLREMQETGAHMAIVIDEYGNVAGLVTMEDMVEEIVGEIHDEHEPERDVKPESEGRFVVPGSLDLDRLHDLIGFRPAEDTESTTIAGLVTEWLGHVPRVGEAAERDGIRVEVLAADELKVEQVRVSKIEQASIAQHP
jgi:CBS domain containing-hemolysin-like protein